MPIRSSLRRLAEAASCLLLALASCDVVAPVDAGPASFVRVIGGAGGDEAFDIEQTPDGGYVIAGQTTSFGAGETDMYLVRTDAGGSVMWERTFGGARGDGASAVLVLDDGYMVVGFTVSFGRGGYDAYVVRTDLAGDTLWTRAIGTEARDAANTVVATADGGFLVGGSTVTSVSRRSDHYLMRIDARGDTLWTTAINAEREEACLALADHGDGFLIGGFADKQMQLVRLDDNGRELATETPTLFQAKVSSLLTHDRRRYFTVGTKLRTDLDSLQITRVVADGRSRPRIEWARSYGFAGVNQGYAGAIAGDGGIVALGTTRGLGRLQDFFLVKCDSSDGRVLWTKGFGGASDDVGYGLVIARDGGIVMVGSSSSFVDGVNGSDIMLIKTDANGELRE